MKKEYFRFLIFFSILLLPVLAFADGGMVSWPPDIILDQTAQNAITAWNGEEEILILSIDIKGSDNVTALRVIPLPSNPSEIKEGSFEIFENLVEIMNEKIKTMPPDWEGGNALKVDQAEGIEITFQEQIGSHDVTVVKVNDLDYFLNWIEDFVEEKGFQQKQVSSQFRKGVENYLKKNLDHFVFDVIEANPEKESVEPLIYRFETDFLYYPILISGISEISESWTNIDLFLITEKDVRFQSNNDYYWDLDSFYSQAVKLTHNELEQVSEDVAGLFEEEARVEKVQVYGQLKDLDKDIMISPSYIWDTILTVGSRGDEVKALQQLLINEGVWESDAKATGYFGPVTKNALTKFQEEYDWEILDPVDLSAGTGYFGPQTQNYIKSISLSAEQQGLFFNRNLSLGMSGDDIKNLQKALVQEGVWTRPDIEPTGYFGQITKESVIIYQDKYASSILEPLGLVKGTGFVGPSTRKQLGK